MEQKEALPFATDFRVEAGGGGGVEDGTFLFFIFSYFHSNRGTHPLFPKGTVNLFLLFFLVGTTHL